MYSLGRGYEPIDSPYSTPYGAMVLPRIAHRNPVSYYRMLWTAARYSLSRSPQPLRTRRFSLPVPLPFPPISFSLRISVESSTLPTGTMRMAAASLPPRLYASIDTYLPIRAGAMLPISVNKCTPARTYDACRFQAIPFSRSSNRCGYTYTIFDYKIERNNDSASN